MRQYAGYPDDWGEGYGTCDRCGQRYHMSGTEECGCTMNEAVIIIPIELYKDADLMSVLEAVQEAATDLEANIESAYDITGNVIKERITVSWVKVE